MDIPANRARIEFALEGTPYPVIALNGEERLNQGFFFQVDIQIALHRHVEDFVGRRAALRFTGVDGDFRELAALVESAEDVGYDPGGAKRIALGLMPRCRILEQVKGPALWLGLDFKGLVRTLLDEADLRLAGAVRFDFAQTHGTRPWTLRTPGETSAELIQRRMAQEGIFFRVDQKEGREQLIYTDHNAHLPYVTGGAVRRLAEAGMSDTEQGRPRSGVFRIAQHSVARPGAARGYVLPAARPVRPLASDPRTSRRPGIESHFGATGTELPGAQAWAALRDRYNDQQAAYLSLLANRVDLAAGHCLTLEAGPAPGDYLITAVQHHSAQAAGLNVAGPTVPYTCQATLIPRARPYVSAFPPKRRLPPLIGARIESNSPHAGLDDQGCYRLRHLFQPGLNPHARASLPIRKQSPHGGPPSPRGQAVGWHAPLQDGDEVLLSCLNHDPEQLMIAGGLYTPGRKSPVLGDNLTQNIYRSAAGNALIMDDRKAKELIQLHARDGLLCLELNADRVGQWVGLDTREGAAELSARKTQRIQSGDSLTERSGNDRIQQIENRHLTKTKQGEIHHQAALDAAIRAGEYVEIRSGNDTQLIAGKDFRLRIQDNASFTVEQGDARVHVREGEVRFQGTKSMRIRGNGGGPITFEQNGAGFRIRADGTVDLFGKTVSLGGPNGVNFDGPVNYQVPGSAKAPSPQVKGPIEIPPITELRDKTVKPPETKLITPIYPVRFAYANFFKETPLAAAEPPSLAGMLNQSDPARTRGYAARVLRPGWIYIREEDGPGGGHFHIFKYRPCHDGRQLVERFPKYTFANGIDATDGLTEDSSGGQRGGYPFVFVRQEVSTLSIAYSEHQWAPEVIDLMNGSAQARAAAMQRIHIKGGDSASVEASADNLRALVEDYKQHKDRMLTLKHNQGDPDIQDIELDGLTTQGSYDMDAAQVAAALRAKTKPGGQAYILALHDPVGRQRDILEIHNKLAIWEKAYHAENVYPYTIGSLIGGIKANAGAEVQEIVEESINWDEYNSFWKEIDKDVKRFATRKQQFADLYQAFMHGEGLTGKVGSLDTHFKYFFARNLANEEAALAEIGKLSEAAVAVFQGIISSKEGLAALEAVMRDYDNEHNAYTTIFWRAFMEITTKPQKTLNWEIGARKFFDPILTHIGPLWGKFIAYAVYEGQLANRARHNYQAGMIKQTVELVAGFFKRFYGIELDLNHRLRYTNDELGKIIAKSIGRVAAGEVASAEKGLQAAARHLATTESLFKWGERTAKPHEELGEIEIFPYPDEHFAFGKPKTLGQIIGLGVDGVFSGLSFVFNAINIQGLFIQSEFAGKDPLKRGHYVYTALDFMASSSSMIADSLTLSHAAVSAAGSLAPKFSTQAMAALAPKLAHKATSLGTLLSGTIGKNVIIFANLVSAAVSVWDAYNSYQRDNHGEMAGHLVLAFGSAVFLAGAIAGIGSATAATGAATAATGIGAIPGFVIATVGFLAMGVGAALVWINGKSGFQVLLENCFWGKSKRYEFWGAKRDLILQRIDKARMMSKNEVILFSFKVETQEFMNYLYMPSVDINSTEGILDFRDDERTYFFTFILPGFQEGISEIWQEVRTYKQTHPRKPGGWRKSEKLTKALIKAIDKADIKHEKWTTQVSVSIETLEEVKLYWIYQPNPKIYVPQRFITEKGTADQPTTGMLNEDFV